MQILKTHQGDTLELILNGRVDGEGANQLEIALLNATATGTKNVTVEMSDVTFLCSAGLRTLLQTWRQLQGKGGSLRIANPSAEAMTLLGTSGFKDMLLKQG